MRKNILKWTILTNEITNRKKRYISHEDWPIFDYRYNFFFIYFFQANFEF